MSSKICGNNRFGLCGSRALPEASQGQEWVGQGRLSIAGLGSMDDMLEVNSV
jgi:hypothetical protein